MRDGIQFEARAAVFDEDFRAAVGHFEVDRDGTAAVAGSVQHGLAAGLDQRLMALGHVRVAHGHDVDGVSEPVLNLRGGGPVSVYLEVSDGGAEVFVKDRGPGFELSAVPQDRLGVRESIIGRMKRHGGNAVINSGRDGTEVRLRLPADVADNGEGKS